VTDLREHLEELREGWHSQVQGSQLDDLATAGIENRARRSRTARTTLTWASGAAAVTLVAVAVWAGIGLSDDVAPPANSAIPTPTEPAATSPVAAVLPVMPPATEDIWAGVDDDWTLVTLNSAASADNSTPVYLVDPAGKAYALPSVEPDMVVWNWVPGERQAWFSACCDASWVRVDLTTGQTLPAPEWLVDSGIQPLGGLPDGRVWGSDSTGTGTYIVGPEGVVEMPAIDGSFSPDGTLLATSSGVIDTHTGSETPLTGYDDEGRCYPMGWYDSTTVAIACGTRDDASGLVYADGSVRLGDARTGVVRDAPWPEQPGVDIVDTWATTGYNAWSDGLVLVGVGGDPWAGQANPNRHEVPELPSRSQPRLLMEDGALRPLNASDLAPECAMLIAPREELGLIAIRDRCAAEPRLAGLYRLVDGELVPAVPLAELVGEVPGAGISGWAE